MKKGITCKVCENFLKYQDKMKQAKHNILSRQKTQSTNGKYLMNCDMIIMLHYFYLLNNLVDL